MAGNRRGNPTYWSLNPHTCSSTTHSTATSPDVVGPGRTLGLLFDWLGKGLESFLNKRASQLNLGPEAVARDIRRIRRCEERSYLVRYAAPYAHLTRAQDKKVRKLCKNLLRYTRSKVLSTQLKALDEIVKLSMEDRLVREALSQLNAGHLVPKYKEVELSIAISKAIYSISHMETHEIWTWFLSVIKQPFRYLNHFITPEQFDSLKKSLSDPSSSFIAARYLNEIFHKGMIGDTNIVSGLIEHYYDLTVTSPNLIEWSNINAFGNMPMCMYLFHDEEIWSHRTDITVEFIRNSRHLEDFFERLLAAEVITFRANSPDDVEIGEPFSYIEGEVKGINTIVLPRVETFPLLRQLLKTLTGSDDYLSHLSYIHSRDGQTQKAMKDIFIGNEILVISMYIWSHIETKGPAEAGYRCFFLGKEHHDNPTQIRSSNPHHKFNRFKHAITLLDDYCKVSDQVKLEDRALAIFLKKIISSASRYSKLASCGEIARPLSFSQTDAPYWDLFGSRFQRRHLKSYSNMLWRLRSKGKYFFPDDQIINSRRDCIPEIFQTGCIDRVDATVLSAEMVASFMRSDLNSPFNSTSHYPILASLDDSGVSFYLALVYRPDNEWHMRHFFTSVKDGDTVATWYDEHGRANITSDFTVLVLRHDPTDFPIGRNDYPWQFFRPRTGALDPTGPIYWLQYFPEKDPEFFDIELCKINKVILSQNGESALPKSPWLPSPCRCWRHFDKLGPRISQYDIESDDDSEPDVSPLGSDAKEYYSEANSESPLDEVAGPRMDGQSFPSWNKDSDIRDDIAEDTERIVEAEGGFDAYPIRAEDISIERLQRVIEERDLEIEQKDKEIARLQSMLSSLKCVDIFCSQIFCEEVLMFIL
ncbi:hypothetical protein SCHPADRAFT_941480 [Schizopora paradoxa]|uniref:Uncharacterized protein n=1 Tax=Schizopora paradoxa TaxID=27342 RepID=A0A0H2RJF9_9AGAM|nr:hypothetical protein SCHPADRAFT_941480 [Schizopora paradoxa]